MTEISRSSAIELYRKMLEIREFENRIQSLFATGAIRGSTHLCQGQEAVPVGALSLLREGDTMLCTYRGHGAVLAMGAPMDKSFAEILGREGGLCRGKGGSMHLTDADRGILGSFAIVGAHLPIANGAAWSAKYRGTKNVCIAFFGDGATNIGAFHEALNLAALWVLPVVFICENNLYGEYSPLRSTTPISDLARRADAYGMPGVTIDGNDVLAVREAVFKAFERARADEGPTLLEALTYRQVGHSRSDPGKYRPEEEVKEWLGRDPIPRFEAVLREKFDVAPDELSDIQASAVKAVEEALQRASNSPIPAEGSLLEDVYA